MVFVMSLSRESGLIFMEWESNSLKTVEKVNYFLPFVG